MPLHAADRDAWITKLIARAHSIDDVMWARAACWQKLHHGAIESALVALAGVGQADLDELLRASFDAPLCDLQRAEVAAPGCRAASPGFNAAKCASCPSASSSISISTRFSE